MVGFHTETRQTYLIDYRSGLGDADLARDHDYVEPSLKWTLRANSRHGLRNAVREKGRAPPTASERQRQDPHLLPVLCPRSDVRLDQLIDGMAILQRSG